VRGLIFQTDKYIKVDLTGFSGQSHSKHLVLFALPLFISPFLLLPKSKLEDTDFVPPERIKTSKAYGFLMDHSQVEPPKSISSTSAWSLDAIENPQALSHPYTLIRPLQIVRRIGCPFSSTFRVRTLQLAGAEPVPFDDRLNEIPRIRLLIQQVSTPGVSYNSPECH